MSQTHIVSDSCTRIRNAQLAKKSKTTLCYSKLIVGVIMVLKDNGYIQDFEVSYIRESIPILGVLLKYDRSSGKPAITEIMSVSKPGRKIYSTYNNIKSFYSGLGTIILSTSLGVISDHKARSEKVGGELICKVF